MHATRVALAPYAGDQFGALEPLDDACDGSGIEMQKRGECAEGDAWLTADEAEGKPLRRGQAELAHHALRHAVELVVDLPQQADEFERRVGRRGRPETRQRSERSSFRLMRSIRNSRMKTTMKAMVLRAAMVSNTWAPV